MLVFAPSKYSLPDKNILGSACCVEYKSNKAFGLNVPIPTLFPEFIHIPPSAVYDCNINLVLTNVSIVISFCAA